MSKIVSSTLQSRGSGDVGRRAVKEATAQNEINLKAIIKKANAAVNGDQEIRSQIKDQHLLRALETSGK